MSSEGQIERLRRIKQKLDNELGPIIVEALKSPDVIEIMVNPDGSLWIERLGSGMEFIEKTSAVYTAQVIRTVASFSDQVVTAQTPIVSATLPLDGSRFEGLLPPIVASPTFSIRRKASKVFSLTEYVESGIMTQTEVTLLRTAVTERKNMIIAGGTGSGKTTLANAIINEITNVHPAHRLVIIEDTSEIQSDAKNTVQMLTSDTVSMQSLLRSTMRLRPDRIIVGEVRGKEALTLLKAWNTGHPGGIGTIHANNARAALDRLESLIGEETATPMKRLIGEAIDLVVFIEKDGHSRRIVEMLNVSNGESGQFNVVSFHSKGGRNAA